MLEEGATMSGSHIRRAMTMPTAVGLAWTAGSVGAIGPFESLMLADTVPVPEPPVVAMLLSAVLAGGIWFYRGKRKEAARERMKGKTAPPSDESPE
jgi:hypothetical protein